MRPQTSRNCARALYACTGLLAAMLTAEEAKADSDSLLATDELPPPGVRTRIIAAGALTTAAWYGAAVGASYAWSDGRWASELRVPIAGPWLAFHNSGCPSGTAGCSKVTVVLRVILMSMDAIGQAGGLAVLGEGLFLPTAPRAVRAASRKLELEPTFGAGPDSIGFGVAGAF